MDVNYKCKVLFILNIFMILFEITNLIFMFVL
uniref:Uncharacterized protein n=1 Tax=Dulem virus 231 TaxID=3145708 RepID=A0AAU8AV61_9VIRU